MEAGDPFDECGRAAEVNIILFFLLGEAFAKVAFFFLVGVPKIQVEAEAEPLGKVGVGDDGVLVLHIDPGVVVPSLERIGHIVGILADEGGGQADQIWFEVDGIAVFFIEHPGADIVGIGQVAGGGKDEGIAGEGVDPVVAAGVGDIDFPAGVVTDGDGGEDFGCAAAFDSAVQGLRRLLRVGELG